MLSTRMNGTAQNNSTSNNSQYSVVNQAGIRAKRLRIGLGYTRSAFAEMLGTSVEYLNHWESSGKILPRYIETISETLDIDRQWLETGKGRAYPHLLDSAALFLLAPNSAYVSEEYDELTPKILVRTQRAIRALAPEQRERALLFLSNLLVQLSRSLLLTTNRSDYTCKYKKNAASKQRRRE